ncbi:MAG TPA: hypothetical protein VGE38_06965 [Nocardioides sp.]|uniref:hypothetical protein n=1 Tax=Nocardioides sp. TaxID=35761 RepID=UPI002ED9AB2B
MTALDAPVRATAAVGYKAVVDHFVEHGLPAPESIELRDGGMRVWLIFGKNEWLDTLHVDDEVVVPIVGTDLERVHASGRLPGLLGQVKVELRYTRRAEMPAMQAVSA